MFDKYIDEFIPSLEMREFLKVPNPSVDSIADIIYFAPAPIDMKKASLLELCTEVDDNELIEACEHYIKAIRKAEQIMDSDGVFSLETVTYAEKIGDIDYEFDGLFNNCNDLVQFVNEDLEYNEVSDDTPWYYRAIKWINDKSGKLVEACTYWIVRGKVWFVQLDDEKLDDYKPNLYRAVDLNIPVPFKAGDIVEVNLYPFADKRVMGIVEVGDNLDCCCLQALSKTINGGWNVGAVKHGHIGIDILPCISPLYSMTIHKEKPSPEYELLRSVSNIIDGREENGATLWSVLASKHDMTDEELLEIVEKFKELEV